VPQTKPGPGFVSNNFGVGLIGTSSDNLVEDNKIGGNFNGLYIGSGTKGGNVIRRNIIVGNPPVQISTEFGASVGVDIQDLSNPALGANIFEDNRCLTYTGSMEPAPCLNAGTPQNREDTEQGAVAAFGRNRLAFPQARLVNAALHHTSRALPKTAGAAKPGQTADPESVTVIGKVVDAACYMLHAPAATAASHKDCGAACLARGVPLVIAADNGALYFLADGNQRLKSLLNARVRASGTVVEKHDPMELKMPVGDKNQMAVRIEGGYKLITIQTLEKIATSFSAAIMRTRWQGDRVLRKWHPTP
jgi:hypothetical protein